VREADIEVRMPLTLDQLPDDMAALKALLIPLSASMRIVASIVFPIV